MEKKHKYLHQIIKLTAIAVFLLFFNIILYKIFSARALAFGCFDDCANYMAGYFMKHGRELYSEIFYNHIMGMAHFSFAIQSMYDSINIYDLVLIHRKFIIFTSFIFGVLIIKRFLWSGLIFIVMYELTKFYVFGDRFLAESVVVYAAVYLFGLVWEKLHNKSFSWFDYLFAGFLTFFIAYLREPYIPLAGVLFIIFLWGKVSRKKIGAISVSVFFSLAVLAVTPFQDFIFNDLTVNMQTAIKGEAQSKGLLGAGILQMFLNPIYIIFSGKVNAFRVFQIGLSIVFIVGITYQIFNKKWKTALVIVGVLGIANIRIVEPGSIFYEAYHGMVWYGMFLFITTILTVTVLIKHTKLGVVLIGVLIITWFVAVFSPSSYIYDKVDQQEQLLTNFGTVMNVGNVVRELSKSSDTIFLDGADDMIYWQSERFSPYQYSWYTSVMPAIPLYTNARIEMFKTNPPVFYYDFCSQNAPFKPSLPDFIKNDYQQLYSGGNPSCLYVLKSKLKFISDSQWKKAEEGFYTLPKN